MNKFWLVLLLIPWPVGLTATPWVVGQESSLQRISGKHIELITDLELDESVRDLTRAFDAAVPQWCEIFRVDPVEAQQWKATAYVMVARERFEAAGLLPSSIPPFRHGYQWGNEVWVVEQASQYYRRHLLLHEGTHWFMVQKYGSAGPPWLMEGVAEWLATHQWSNGQLRLGVIPHSRTDVPLWGRLALIHEQLDNGLAPGLETILRYDNRAHQSTDAYAWSWAAVVFMQNHPSTREAFRKLFEGKLRDDDESTRQLLRATQNRMPLIRAEWSAMLTGLDYGFDPERELVSLDHRSAPLEKEIAISIDAAKGWQATPVHVKEGDVFRVSASGRYIVGRDPRPWECEPEGVTLRYHDGYPLGKLLLAIADPQAKRPEFSQRLTTLPIGKGAQVTASATGQILLRINETGADLNDNSGQLTVTLDPR